MAAPDPHKLFETVLRSQKELFWHENDNLPPDEIQRQWETTTQNLVALLTAPPPARSVSSQVTRNEQESKGREKVTSPTTSIPNARKRASDSTEMAPPMSKKRSSQSQPGPNTSGFTGEQIPPVAMDAWRHDTNAPFNGFTARTAPHPAFKMRKTSHAQLPLQIPEHDQGIEVFDDPADYFKQAQHAVSPTLPLNVRPRRSLSQKYAPSSPYESSSTMSRSPATSMSDAFIIPTPITSVGMSRENTQNSLCELTETMRVGSQPSDFLSPFEFDNSSHFNPQSTSNDSQSMGISSFDPSLSVSFVGGVADDASTSVSNIATCFPSASTFEHDVSLSRSLSSTSNDSSKSSTSRRSLKEVVQSARPIMPKEKLAVSMSREPSSSSTGAEMARERSADGSKVLITKERRYVRPAHPKVKCDQCDVKPEGFRGPHELRRHMENKHSKHRTVWVTKDVSPDGKFLSNCKACNERREYGAYYNAAAHLRRIHFHAKEKGRKSKGNSKEKPRGRGGDGGGDDPPMDIIKLWIEEIKDVSNNTQPIEDDDKEEPILDDQAHHTYEPGYSQPDLSSPEHYLNDFVLSHASDLTPSFANPTAYGSPTTPIFSSSAPIAPSSANAYALTNTTVDQPLSTDSSFDSSIGGSLESSDQYQSYDFNPYEPMIC